MKIKFEIIGLYNSKEFRKKKIKEIDNLLHYCITTCNRLIPLGFENVKIVFEKLPLQCEYTEETGINFYLNDIELKTSAATLKYFNIKAFERYDKLKKIPFFEILSKLLVRRRSLDFSNTICDLNMMGNTKRLDEIKIFADKIHFVVTYAYNHTLQSSVSIDDCKIKDRGKTLEVKTYKTTLLFDINKIIQLITFETL